jgi:tRNA pseudouridine32 synthase / 23S rRNA pseudouridine746 synthase
MGKRKVIPANLRPRNGLNPTRVRLPDAEATQVGRVKQFETGLAYLQARFPDSADRIAELVSNGEVYDDDGEPVNAQTPFQPHTHLYLFRDPPTDEPIIEALNDIEVLYQDDNLLVIDKPHQVSVIPRGRWVTQTALVYLRNKLDMPGLAPVHRLDRPTAGVLVFTTNPEVRGAYQMLFQDRRVQKEYLAVTAASLDTDFADKNVYPHVIRNRIVKVKGIARAQEVLGEPNAETEIELVGCKSIAETSLAGQTGLAGQAGLPDQVALWRLKPKTGKTHQLRLHMTSIGFPIIGDPFWPEMRAELAGDPDPDPPLQLLAKVIEFIDPLTGEQRRFESRRSLNCWE